MLRRIKTKIKSNISIYLDDLKTKGIKKSIIHRLIKFNTTRSIYSLFIPEKIKIHNSIMYIDKNDTIVSHTLLLDKTWEEVSTKVISKNLRKGDTFVDVGAHIGYYSLLAAKLVGKNGKVFSFEPDPKNHSLLIRNVEVNSYKNITIIKKAISDKVKRVKFYVNNSNTGDNSFFNNGNKRLLNTILTTTLDNELYKEKINFIKMDIQGSELNALRGMKKILKNNKDIKLLIEFWPEGIAQNKGNYKDLLKLLEKESFLLSIVDDKKDSITKTSTKMIIDLVEKGKLYDANLLCIRHSSKT